MAVFTDKHRFIIGWGAATLILAGAAVGLFIGHSFAHDEVRDQLAAQKIFFPPKSEAKPGGKLDPAEFPGLQQYAGQQVDSGPEARAYAEQFIGKHLTEVAGGKTYSEISALAQKDPKNVTLQAQKNTLFQGTMLRGQLLEVWGWSAIAQIALVFTFLAVGTAVVTLGLCVFEIATLLGRRKAT